MILIFLNTPNLKKKKQKKIPTNFQGFTTRERKRLDDDMTKQHEIRSWFIYRKAKCLALSYKLEYNAD